MKLLKSLSQTFVPFLVLLVLIIISIIYFDVLAEKLSNEPELIEISTAQANKTAEFFWEFETEPDKVNSGVLWKDDSSYINGKVFYDNKEWDKAENYFLTLSNNYPSSPQIFNLLGLIQYKKRDYINSVAAYKKALSLQPDHSSTLTNLAILYVKINRYAEAEGIYQKVITLNPNNPKPYLNLGILYCKNQKWDQVNNYLILAKDLASGNTKSKILYYSGLAYLNLNDTLNSRKNLEEAILIKPDYILPRVQLALTSTNTDKQIDELKKVIQLKPNYATAYYHLGIIYRKMGDGLNAESNLKKAVKLNPKNEELQIFLAEYYLDNDKTLEAETIFKQLKQNDQKLPQNYFNMGKVASRKGEYQQAIAFYDSALMITVGDFPEAHLNKGLILRKIGKEEEAIDAYREAIKFDKNYSEAYYNLAIANQKLKRDDIAINSYHKALKINKSYAKAWYNLGVIYNRKDDLDSAVLCYQEAVNYSPTYLKALVNLGITLNRLDKALDAIQCYKKAITLYPNYSRLWFNLAIAYKNNGEKSMAIDAYEKVLSLEPNDTKARKNLGVLYASAGKIDQAVQSYREAIDLNMSDFELRYNLALILLDHHQISDAVSELSKSVQLNPSYKKGYEKLYEIYYETDDLNKASKTLSEKLIHFPNKNEAYKMGREWQKSKKYNEAIIWYDKAIALGKKNHWVYYWKGMAYAKQNEMENAIQFYKKTLEINPKSKFAHLRLGEAFEKQKKSADASKHYKKVFELDAEFARSKNIVEKIASNN